jgi:dTDP-glucose pyrophosphorylase/CBS domain-containing protein
MSKPVYDYAVRLDSTVSEVISCIDRSARVSIAIVVDDELRLLNTLSDGDVRRGLLAGLQLSSTVQDLLTRKADTPHPVAVTAPVATGRATLLSIMQERGIRQVPLLDKQGRVVDVVILAELLPQVMRPLQAVVMAGGKGIRLRPLTEETPKPMLPVAGRPLMEHIVQQLRDTGVTRIDIATHYQSEKIMEHFGDGAAFGVRINYVQEESPLGTGGALGLLERPVDPILVINGDILTQVDFRTMFLYHQDQGADLTVAVRRYEMQVPYGVIDCEGSRVRGLREKPDFSFFVNAGIYLLEPAVFDFIPVNQHLNMTELISALLAAGRPVTSFPICEYWLDIGQHEDYQQAQEDAKAGKLVSCQ